MRIGWRTGCVDSWKRKGYAHEILGAVCRCWWSGDGMRTRRFLRAVIEWNRWACETIRENQERGFPLVQSWPLHQGDVRDFDWNKFSEPIDLVAGGPPCQPFSLGGKHGANGDRRDMFPAAVDFVRRLRPRAFIFENVKGLTRSSFANYFQYILFNWISRSREGETARTGRMIVVRLQRSPRAGPQRWLAGRGDLAFPAGSGCSRRVSVGLGREMVVSPPHPRFRRAAA